MPGPQFLTWKLSNERCFRRLGTLIVGANFHPFAREMHVWLAANGKLTWCGEEHKQFVFAYANDYTYAASAIGQILSRVVNDVIGYTKGEGTFETPLDVEIARIRLESELYLYTARFVEAITKQLLYCTDIAPEAYKSAALGQLVERAGLKKGDPPIALIGSLADMFKLESNFQNHVYPFLKTVNSRRRAHAAHADSSHINVRDDASPRGQLGVEHRDYVNGFTDMLAFFGYLESRMEAGIEQHSPTLLLRLFGAGELKPEVDR